MHAQPNAAPRSRGRAAWLLFLGLALLIVTVLAVVAGGRGDRNPAASGTSAADCDEQPPPSEFAVAACDGDAHVSDQAAPREP